MKQQNDPRMKEIHKINLILTYAIISLIVGSLLVVKGEGAIVYAIIGVAIATVSTIIYFVPVHDKIKALLFVGIPAIVVTALFFLDGYALNKHYILIFTIIMIALYFEEQLILIFSAILSVIVIALYILSPTNFLGPNAHFAQFITVFFLIVGTSISLFYLTKAGRKLLTDSEKKAQETAQLYEQLEGVLQTVEVSAAQIDEKVKGIKVSTNEVSAYSEKMKDNAETMTASIQEETTSIGVVHDEVTNTQQSINEAAQVSSQVVADANNVNEHIEMSARSIHQATAEMNIMNQSIETTVETVTHLQNSLQKVNTLLSGIQDIANQTNLLALNASIEAARAGEHGKGFAIVAEEVRKLAEQSNHFAGEINEVTKTLFANSADAYKQSIEGQKAMENVNQNLHDISQVFAQIQQTFGQMKLQLNDSNELIANSSIRMDGTKDLLAQVVEMSTWNRETVEQMQSFVLQEVEAIQNIDDAMEQLYKLSEKLALMCSQIK